MKLPYEQMEELVLLKKDGKTNEIEYIIVETINNMLEKNKNQPNGQFIINRYFHLLFGYSIFQGVTMIDRIIYSCNSYNRVLEILNKEHHLFVMDILKRYYNKQHYDLSMKHNEISKRYIHMYDKLID